MSLSKLTVGMPEAGDLVKLFQPYLDGLAKPTINLTVNIPNAYQVLVRGVSAKPIYSVILWLVYLYT
jgi:hypothetical protein